MLWHLLHNSHMPYVLSTCLQALHAFCLADVTLCMSSNDPARFVRCLAPYLKVPPMDKDTPIKDKRRAAERTLCILSVLTALLGSLDRLPAALAQEMEADLCQLIESHQFVQVGNARELCQEGHRETDA